MYCIVIKVLFDSYNMYKVLVSNIELAVAGTMIARL